ncbi:hypothetical protein B0H13DRAFT_2311588 [Mycena leptocephala]|nr:hypothetical protein B0H13DRAFT_2311588 [Mycena leptocephala]
MATQLPTPSSEISEPQLPTPSSETLEPQLLTPSSELSETVAVSNASRVDVSVPALRLLPTCPERFRRYSRQRTIEKRYTEFLVQPLTRSFSRDSCSQWTHKVHPEGGAYFVHSQLRIFTDAYLHDHSSFTQITSAVDQLLARPEVSELLTSELNHIDLVLDLKEETPENCECGYYLVDHSSRIIFWLDIFNMSSLRIWNCVPGIQTPSHNWDEKSSIGWQPTLQQRRLRRAELIFRLHCEYFPAALSISRDIVHELRSTIIYGAMTSSTSTLFCPVEHMLRMLTLVDGMMNELVPVSGESNAVMMSYGPVSIVARFMKTFVTNQFHHFHGEKTARLHTAQSVYDSCPKRSYLITVVSPLLLNAPYTRLLAIEAMYKDQWLNFSSWNHLFTGLRSEWYDLVLYGALVLNTNVGFLAIPASNVPAAAQVSSYGPMCFGLGSIITGLILLRLYPLKVGDSPSVNQAVCSILCHIELGLKEEADCILPASFPNHLRARNSGDFLCFAACFDGLGVHLVVTPVAQH